MNLRVVTVTHSGRRGDWLRECMDSVADSLPAGARHVVIGSRNDASAWMVDQWNATHGADWVAFVDDDDILAPGALQACLDALRDTGASMAFTDEQEVDEAGQHLRMGMTGPRTLRDIAMHPRCAHGCAVFRRAAVPDAAFDTAKREGIGLDWLMRASAGLIGGAVHVPMVGYRWRRHAGQSSSAGHADPYAEAMPALRAYLRGLMRFDQAIPQWHLKEVAT